MTACKGTAPSREAALDAALGLVRQRLELLRRDALLGQLVQRLLEVGHRQHRAQEEHLRYMYEQPLKKCLSAIRRIKSMDCNASNKSTQMYAWSLMLRECAMACSSMLLTRAVLCLRQTWVLASKSWVALICPSISSHGMTLPSLPSTAADHSFRDSLRQSGHQQRNDLRETSQQLDPADKGAVEPLQTCGAHH